MMIGVQIPPLGLSLQECTGPNSQMETQRSDRCQSSRINTGRSDIEEAIPLEQWQQLTQQHNQLSARYSQLFCLYQNLELAHERLIKEHAELLASSQDSLQKLQYEVYAMDYPLILPGIGLEIRETPIKILEEVAIQTETVSQCTQQFPEVTIQSVEIVKLSSVASRNVLQTVEEIQSEYELQNQTEVSVSKDTQKTSNVFQIPFRRAGSVRQRILMDLSVKTDMSFSREIQTPLKRHKSITIKNEEETEEPKSAFLKPKRSNEEQQSRKDYEEAMKKMKRNFKTVKLDTHLKKLQKDLECITSDCPAYQHPYFLAILGICLLFLFLYVQ